MTRQKSTSIQATIHPAPQEVECHERDFPKHEEVYWGECWVCKQKSWKSSLWVSFFLLPSRRFSLTPLPSINLDATAIWDLVICIWFETATDKECVVWIHTTHSLSHQPSSQYYRRTFELFRTLRQWLCSILRGELRIARARNSPHNIKQNCWREEKGKEVNYKISMRIMRSIKAIISSSDDSLQPIE